VFDGILIQAILFDLNDGLPVELTRIPEIVEGRVGGTVEHNVKPVIFFEALGGVVIVRGEGRLAGSCAALDFDETDANSSFGIFGVWQVRNEVKAAILSLIEAPIGTVMMTWIGSGTSGPRRILLGFRSSAFI